ncbi:methionyl-tRNA formyltransferase [Actinomyces minihominis]|uniref:methionyl-tRNA formyltransferase n=1 Tax=Actinomyces minihominis TaxID=2002838 RepID=UPI000C07CA96|nr:methionyl-tRNA formyltransferase [Actinomyces minihominis]
MSLRVVFAGTPAVAVPTLRALYESEHEVVGVITRPPKRRGRSKALIASDVAQFADSVGLPLLETERPASEESLAWLTSLGADLGVVVAYGALLPQHLLDALPLGWINLHFSDLPDLRGAAPVQRALLRGDTSLTSSVFQLEAGMDTGPVFSREKHDLGPEITSGEALAKMALSGAEQVTEVVDLLASGRAVATVQDTGVNDTRVSLAPKLSRQDGFVDFVRSSTETKDQIRAVSPDPGAWTLLPDGSVMKISGATVVEPTGSTGLSGTVSSTGKQVLVACGEGQVALREVAPAGKRQMAAIDWYRGARLEEGARLGRKREEGK